MGARKPCWRQAREYTLLKLAVPALATYVTTFGFCVVLAMRVKFGVALLPLIVPLLPMWVMFVLGFAEQRMGLHVVASLLATLAALLAAWVSSDGEWLGILGNFAVIPIAIVTWFLAGLGSALGVMASRSRYTIVIGRRGHCPACGYCLTGLPKQICPECGRAFELEEVGMVDDAKSVSCEAEATDKAS